MSDKGVLVFMETLEKEDPKSVSIYHHRADGVLVCCHLGGAERHRVALEIGEDGIDPIVIQENYFSNDEEGFLRALLLLYKLSGGK